MKLNTLFISVTAIVGLASTANAYATSSFSAFDGSSTAHTALRHILVGDRKLDAGISLPSAVVRSNANVAAVVLCFTPAGDNGSNNVASYDINTGSWSLDDERQAPGSRASGGCSHELQG